MYLEWLDKRFSVKERLKRNSPLLILLFVYLILGVELIRHFPNEDAGLMGKFLLIVDAGGLIIFFSKWLFFSKNRVLAQLRKKGIHKQDLLLMDEELSKFKYDTISISQSREKVYITEHFIVIDYRWKNKVDAFNISSLSRILAIKKYHYFTPGGGMYGNSNYTYGVIEFYDKNKNIMFQLVRMDFEDIKKIYRYFTENRKEIGAKIID